MIYRWNWDLHKTQNSRRIWNFFVGKSYRVWEGGKLLEDWQWELPGIMFQLPIPTGNWKLLSCKSQTSVSLYIKWGRSDCMLTPCRVSLAVGGNQALCSCPNQPLTWRDLCWGLPTRLKSALHMQKRQAGSPRGTEPGCADWDEILPPGEA